LTWTVLYTPAAQRDVRTIRKRHPHLVRRLETIDATLRRDPFDPAHGFEALRADLTGYYSRRLDGVNRVVYRLERPGVIVVACLGHYDDH
jgi:toxin YoeB